MNMPLLSFTRACADVASVAEVWLIRAEHVITDPQPDPDTYIITDPVQIAPNTAFLRYEFEEDTCFFREESNAGIVTQRFGGSRQGLSASLWAEIQRMLGGEYVAILRLYSGQVLKVGTAEQPATLEWSAESGFTSESGAANDWEFVTRTHIVAPHMDSSIEPPNELIMPVADLDVFEAGDCLYRIVAADSQRINGTFITALAASPTLQYDFIHLGVLLARAQIAPNADASDPASWTLISGSKSSTDWEFEFVSQFTGTGYSFTWSPIDLGGVLPDQQIEVVLRIIEGSVTSTPSATGIVFTCSPGIGTMIIESTFLVD